MRRQQLLFACFSLFVFSLSTSAFADAAKSCLNCHPSRGASVVSREVPFLAGQNPEYIVRQLERFAVHGGNENSQRLHSTMSHADESIKRSEWMKIATDLSSDECVNFGILTKSTVGQEPCATCHGSQGITDDSEMPNLAGQSLSYLVYQYRLFREQSLPDSQRTKTKTDYNRVHPIMGSISANITENVITILAYYSKLPCRAQ